MPRKHKRKTTRNTNLDALDKAAKLVEREKKSVKSAAALQGVSRNTLQRFLKCSPLKRKIFGYSNCSLKATIFFTSKGLELANYVKNLDACFHGLTPMKVCDLAYEFAKAHNINTNQLDTQQNYR